MTSTHNGRPRSDPGTRLVARFVQQRAGRVGPAGLLSLVPSTMANVLRALSLCVLMVGAARGQITQEPDHGLEHSGYQVVFEPESLLLYEGYSGSTRYTLTYNNHTGDFHESVEVQSGDEAIATLTDHVPETVEPATTPVAAFGNFSIKGLWLGRTQLWFKVPGDNGTAFLTSYTVRVLRTPRVIDMVFNIVLTIAIIVSNFMFGCIFDLGSARDILRRPVAPVIGFVCQYTIMPVTSFLVGWALGLSVPLRLGLLAMGCSPGGGNSNTWTLNLNGDVTLSLVMTFISNICALFMMPMWLLTLGQFMMGSTVDIPFSKIITALAFFVGPILIGLGLTKWKPIVGKVVRKIVRPYTLLQALFMITVGLWSNWYIFRFCSDWRLPVAGMTLPYVGMTIGMIVAAIFRQGRARIITIGIETAFQNGALALVIMRRSLPQPEADIASVAPIIAAILTPLPVVVAFIVLVIKTKCVDRVRGKGAYAKAPTEETADTNDNCELKQPLDDATA